MLLSFFMVLFRVLLPGLSLGFLSSSEPGICEDALSFENGPVVEVIEVFEIRR